MIRTSAIPSETTPSPNGREVLVRITACGVCHSDVHLRDGYFDLGGGKKVDLTRSMAPPRTMGHEIVGEVIAVGDGVKASEAAVGQHRVVFPWVGCGQCNICKAGE